MIDDSGHEDSVDIAMSERKLVRKLDTRLLPFLSFMYLFSSLDRSSLGTLDEYLF
jgi:hypothetical protein